MSKRVLSVGVLVLGLLASVATAGLTVTRLEVGGVAQVLRAPTGGFGGMQSGTRLGYNTATDRIHWGDTASGGFEIFWVDVALYGNLGGAHDSGTGVARNYTSDTHSGTVTSGPVVVLNSYSTGFSYLPDLNTMINVGGSGNTSGVFEYQAAKSVSGADVVGEGTNAAKVNTARLISRSSPTLTTGSFHTGLAYVGSDATNYNFIFIDRIGGSSQNAWDLTLTKAYSVAPTAILEGQRTLTRTSGAVTATDLNNLVPGVNDWIQDIANDSSGNVYVLSADGAHNYLSAFSLSGGFAQLDLGPGAALYADLAGLVTDTGGTDVAGRGIAVNGDASKIYVSTTNNIFIFESAEVLPVAEPAGLGLIGLALLGLKKRRSY